ncbi:Sec-independent protein translocase subunit TatA [Streptomyces sp. ODS28]|uniref:Sec-independent protein translocase subunit TatA n=1 Tax=Streptomyces sp. ODS28 TaxID=3136688 RepID=UPI0031E715E0
MLRNGLEPWHLLIVVLVCVILFGSKKLPDAARSLGRSVRILKSETRAMRQDGTDGGAENGTEDATRKGAEEPAEKGADGGSPEALTSTESRNVTEDASRTPRT